MEELVEKLVASYLQLGGPLHSLLTISPRKRDHAADIADLAEIVDEMKATIEALRQTY